ncbi:hypothetical protein BG846_00767 [Streptomyces fradiae ATCC 10745 = DSM 40063]|uniref:Uncharacterized protein n=1 Tax=Streptomyces fradiae ATCC 10745 = DSM 40063 TaxID=1319510 RepID=A0A1Y2P2A0_STRFR|nr:hypothetical protein BG846_00767 [Streptomyces fradiae ATCC 10745 = DSM 40063]
MRPTGTRSRTTSVPANTSPTRRPRADTSEAMHAMTPNDIRISTIPSSPRTSACRNRIGPPSSRTTRSPHAIFPSDRPRLSVSTMIGPPISTSTNDAIDTAITAASSNDAVARASAMDMTRYTVHTTTRSMSSASARLGSLAGRSPSTTASPVTTSLMPPTLLRPCATAPRASLPS